MITNGEFNKDGQMKVQRSFARRWPRKFCSEMFYNVYEKLIQTPNKGNSWYKVKFIIKELFIQSSLNVQV
jgi:hypothetical protein